MADNTWSVYQEIALIKFWEEKEYLWQTKHKDYYRRELRNAALEAACEALDKDINGVPFTAANIKKKIKHLRDMFMREMKKVESSKISMSHGSVDCVYSSKWAHFKRLQFFNKSVKADFIKEDNFPLVDNLSPAGDSADGEAFECFTTVSSPGEIKLSGGSTCNRVEFAQDVVDETTLTPSRSPPQQLNPAAKRPKRMVETPSENDDMFCKAIQVMNEKPPNFSPEDIFGIHVANTLKTLSKRKKAYLKLDIQQLLFKYEIEDEGI